MTKIKVCGLSEQVALRVAIKSGADAVGFVVKSPASSRNITLPKAGKLIKLVPPFVSAVTVTASRSQNEIDRISRQLQPDIIQLHNIANLEVLRKISNSSKKKLIGTLTIEAGTKYSHPMVQGLIKKAQDLAELVSGVLVDSSVRGVSGGTGRKSDWSIIRVIRDAIAPSPLILAGGLTPENVSKAIEVVEPYAVDVSSGVESQPGKKAIEKIQLFIERVKGG